jgi:hypothetical protein
MPGIFNDPGNIHALHNLLDAFGVPRENTKHSLKEPAAFFFSLRRLTGSLNQIQVDTINAVLSSASHWSIGWVAYGLATAWHEARFKPIPEIGKGKGRAYGKPGARMKPYAGAPTYGGQIPYGRGLVQLTWVENYEWADNECSKAGLIQKGDILKDFDLVMRPDLAVFILVRGMETGKFTGKSLRNYIGERGDEASFVRSRLVINGTDRAYDIAEYATHFQNDLDAGGWA